MKTLQLIQLLRFVAAFLVVLSHSAYLLGLHQSVSAQLSYAFAFGNVGVHIFFVISGFIMVFTTFGPRAKQIGPTEFLRRRFVRIYPIYWIYAGLTLSIMAQKLSGYEIAAAAVLWPPYSSTIIGQGWTLTYEVAFYLCFAAIIPMGMLRGLSALTITFVILVALHPLVPAGPVWQVVTNPLIFEFLFGAWLGAAFARAPKWPSGRLLLSIALALLMVGFLAGYNRAPSVAVWGIPAAILVGGALGLEREHARWAAKIAFLGDSSYSLYLLRALILGALFSIARPSAHPVTTCIVFSGIAIAAAMPPYYLVELQIVRLFAARQSGWKWSVNQDERASPGS